MYLTMVQFTTESPKYSLCVSMKKGLSSCFCVFLLKDTFFWHGNYFYFTTLIAIWAHILQRKYIAIRKKSYITMCKENFFPFVFFVFLPSVIVFVLLFLYFLSSILILGNAFFFSHFAIAILSFA